MEGREVQEKRAANSEKAAPRNPILQGIREGVEAAEGDADERRVRNEAAREGPLQGAGVLRLRGEVGERDAAEAAQEGQARLRRELHRHYQLDAAEWGVGAAIHRQQDRGKQ